MKQNKTKKTVLLCLTVIVILGIFYLFSKKEEISNITTSLSMMVSKKTQFCFAHFSTPDKDGYSDKYTLRLNLAGGKATGELKLLPAEKDSMVGTLDGTVSPIDIMTTGRTADLWWDAAAEGTTVKNQLKIMFNNNDALIGLGEMVDRGDGVYVYKDPKKVYYALNLENISCDELTTREAGLK